jgi:DNA-binding winged helix-turn-helix (wHTH) protein
MTMWSFDRCSYSRSRGLERDGRQIDLQPKVAALLELLLVARGRIVSKADISAALWPSGSGSDDSIARCVSLLRRALAERGGSRLVRSIYGVGVQLSVTPEVVARKRVAPPPRHIPPAEMVRTAHEIASTRTEEALTSAAACLRLTTDLFPAHADAWVQRADFAAARAMHGFIDAREAAAEIDLAVAHHATLNSDDGLPRIMKMWSDIVLRGQRRGVGDALPPVGSRSCNWMVAFYAAWLRAVERDLDGALAQIDDALAINPLERRALNFRAWLLYCAGRFEEADVFVAAVHALRPDIAMLDLAGSAIASALGEPDRALALAERGARAFNHDGFSLTFVGCAHAAKHDAEAAREVLQRLRNKRAPQTFVATLRSATGDRYGARNLLEKAARQGCPWHSLSWCDPRLRA